MGKTFEKCLCIAMKITNFSIAIIYGGAGHQAKDLPPSMVATFVKVGSSDPTTHINSDSNSYLATSRCSHRPYHNSFSRQSLYLLVLH